MTSKDVLERTGISRATLNNYIATGLLPRPEVLPPNPEDGAAPRIGYFPEGTVERVLDIQRLKREGWSIARISAHFSSGGQAVGVPAARPAPELRSAPAVPFTGSAAAAAAAAAATAAARSPAVSPMLSLGDTPFPAFLLDDTLKLVWANEASRIDAASPLHGLPAGAGPAEALERLLAWRSSDAVLHFLLGLAKQRGASLAQVTAGQPFGVRSRVEASFAASPVVDALPAAQLLVPAEGGRGRVLQAVQFREGLLFVCGLAPAAVAREDADPGRFPAPALLPVAVLVTTLEDAHTLWLRLPAREYFELLSEIWAELDTIFKGQDGRHSGHPGDGMVCYFLPQSGADYLAHSLQAAVRVREAMRRVSSRWQSRKGWDVELRMNTGVDAGQEWIGPLRRVDPIELAVLGAAADNARELSRSGRDGVIWITRGLVDRLPPADRERLQYGAPRRAADGSPARVLASFARLQEVASASGTGPVHAAIADLPITELLELAPAGRHPSPGQAPA